MNPIPITPETLSVARNVIWFEPPEHALADPLPFMAYAFPGDMRLIRQYVSDDDFRDALDHAPPGIIDPRSWAYWNSKMGRYPPPPAPVRRFPAVAPEMQRAEPATAWSESRARQPTVRDLEEIRRKARENWRTNYEPNKKRSD
jgi:hypothetical protein